MTASHDQQDEPLNGPPPVVHDDTDEPVAVDVRSRLPMAGLTRDFVRRRAAQRLGTTTRPISSQEIVNGLDQRELLLGSIATVAGIGLSIFAYYWGLHSSNAQIKTGASTFLIAMLIGTFLLGLGTVLRRRAMLGFASFFFGLEQISYDSRFAGLVFFAFGSWLIWRVLRKSKTDRALGIAKANRPTRVSQTRAAARPPSASAPKPSKRYTPPKPTRSARR